MSAVIFEVHASSAKELQELFWDGVASNNASLQSLVTLWLQLTESLAGKLQTSSATEKERDAVLQLLTKLDVVRLAGSTSDHQSKDTSGTVSSEVKVANDNAKGDDVITPAAPYTAPYPVAAAGYIGKEDDNGKTKECPRKKTPKVVPSGGIKGTKYKGEGEDISGDDGGSDENNDDDDDSEIADEDEVNNDKQSELCKHTDPCKCRQKWKVEHREQASEKTVVTSSTFIKSGASNQETTSKDYNLKIQELSEDTVISKGVKGKEEEDARGDENYGDDGEDYDPTDDFHKAGTESDVDYDKKKKEKKHSRCIGLVSSLQSVESCRGKPKCREEGTSSVSTVDINKTTKVSSVNVNPYNTRQKVLICLEGQEHQQKPDTDFDTTANGQSEMEREDLLDPQNKRVNMEASVQNEQSDSNLKNMELVCHICGVCGQEFDDPLLAEQHIDVTHDIDKKQLCTLCGKRFFKLFQLKKHMQCSHKEGQSQPRKKCSLCVKVFKKENFDGHECNPRPKQNVHCDFGDQSFASKKAAEKHIQETHAENNLFQSSICDKVLGDHTSFQKHATIHRVKKESSGEHGTFQSDKYLKLKVSKNLASFKEQQEPAVMFQCKYCGQRSSTQENLEKHVNEDHKMIKTHFCDLCPKGYSKKSELTQHVRRIHEKSIGAVCDICGKRFGNKDYLKTHYLVHFKDKYSKTGPQCELCGKFFLNSVVLRSHMVSHGPKNVKCDLCEKTFKWANRLKIHMESVHLKIREKLCQECGAAFHSAANLKEHVNAVHRNYRPHVCEECGKGFLRADYLKRHCRTHERGKKVKAPRPRPEFKCDQCDRVCRTQSVLKKHKFVHITERNFKCDKCSATFKSECALSAHIKTVHLKIRRHVCPECGKKFGHTGVLKRHIQKVHKKEKYRMLPCTLCEKQFYSKNELKTHTDWHKGLVDLKCCTCGKEFTTKHSLDVHMKIHRSDGWRCSECGLRFKNQEQRTKHKMEEHFGVTDWNKCKECGKEFTTHLSMRRHMKNHTGAGWKCAFCGEVFPTVYAKRKHAMEVHSSKAKSNWLVEPQLESDVESESQQAISFIVTSDQMIHM